MADPHLHWHRRPASQEPPARARGRVLDIGAGLDYPLAEVNAVVALECDPAGQGRLPDRAAPAALTVEVLDASVAEASFADESFDTVVSRMVLCRVPDLEQTAAALRRWLRPDGEWLFVEHGIGQGARGRLQRAATPAWSRLAGGCRLDRDVVGALRRSGWLVTALQHFQLPGAGPLFGDGLCGVARPRLARAAA